MDEANAIRARAPEARREPSEIEVSIEVPRGSFLKRESTGHVKRKGDSNIRIGVLIGDFVVRVHRRFVAATDPHKEAVDSPESTLRSPSIFSKADFSGYDARPGADIT